MTYFPYSVGRSTNPFTLNGFIDPTNVILTTNLLYSIDLIDMNFTALGSRSFTLDSDKGRFIPLSLVITVTDAVPSGSITPTITITHSNGSFLGTTSLSVISNSFGIGCFDTGIAFGQGSTYISAVAGDNVAFNITTASTASRDLRTVSLLGVYVG